MIRAGIAVLALGLAAASPLVPALKEQLPVLLGVGAFFALQAATGLG